MAIIKPEVNIPLSVTLQGPIGEQIQGQYGVQFQYGMVEGLIYADAKLHAALAPHPVGSQVTILKTQEQFTAQDGSLRKANNYAVTPVGSAPLAPQQAVTQPINPNPSHQNQTMPVAQEGAEEALAGFTRLLYACHAQASVIFPANDVATYNATYTLYREMRDAKYRDYGNPAPPMPQSPPLPQAPEGQDLPF